jgi:hypothetical protein
MDRSTWKLEDNKQALTLALPGNPPVKLDTAAVDDLLKGLGALRAQMAPPQPSDDPRGKVNDAVVINPRWATEKDIMRGQVLLHVRDPRFGALAFLLPNDEAKNLGHSLVTLAERPAQQTGKSN